MTAFRSISVVIPSFERQRPTERAVRSALAQEGPIGEVIVVDDGSSTPFDGSAVADPRLRIVRLARNAGAAAARQAGVDAAQGDLIAFLDSDDTWLPGKTAAQLSALGSVPDAMAGVVCGWRGLVEGGESYIRHPLPGDTLDDFASGCWFSPGSTLIVPRAAFELAGPFDTALRRLEDYEWFLRFALKGGRLLVAPVVGAEIAQGRRARPDVLIAARRAILSRHAHDLPAGTARNMRAYLHLEAAAAWRNSGNVPRMVLELAQSFALVPRLQVPLRRWWQPKLG